MGRHYTDAETGFQYLRARYYDPATGQFLNRDPLEALTGQPYAYAENNPLNLTDPTGMCVLCRHPSVHIDADKWVRDRASNVANVGKRAVDNSLVRGVATAGAIGLVCSSGIGCALLVGAATGGALGLLNAEVNQKCDGPAGSFALGMITGATNAATGGIYGELSSGTASSATQFLTRSVPGTIIVGGVWRRLFG